MDNIDLEIVADIDGPFTKLLFNHMSAYFG